MAKPSALSSLIEEGQLPIKQRKLLGEETAETLRELILPVSYTHLTLPTIYSV